MTFKRFRTGSGRLDANNLNRFMRTSAAVDRLPTPGQEFRPRWYGPIVCQITDSTQISLGKYRYTVREVRFSTPETYAAVSNGFESDRVVNLAERDNGVDSVSGLDPELLPGSYALRKIPDEAIVACFVAANNDATNPNTVWFDRPGEFFGGCPE